MISRIALCALAVGLVGSRTAPVHAAEKNGEPSYASPQHFAVEFKLGPYAPNIDSEFGGSATPFKDIFGDGTGLMIRGELDYQFWGGFGSIGAGLQLGYYGKSAQALQDTGSGGGTAASAGETGITLFPISLLAVYRFDVLAKRFKVPLVPFAKFGLNYTRWWIFKGDGGVASFEGHKAAGGTFGWQVNLGGALLLDIFEPSAAKNLDNELGINHTYLFFEFQHIASDGLGAKHALRVGATTWQAGLAFEF
ncbi:MAG: hypothetical protein IT371_10320 [Deltaproteobacteria bacterium]|nr:hypothetical protein [Deltaproteobacteria bacterium]